MDGTILYWRRSYSVKAVRLTVENIVQIAEELGLDYSDDPNGFGHDTTTSVPHITSVRRGYGFIGDWIVVKEKDFQFFTNDVFAEKFRTHSEQMADDEKYAKVFQLVFGAMEAQAQATFHQDTDGMDLVAIKTAKKIIGEI